jgi:glycine/D-amino acid oxidase-like deaminating enzyme
MPVAVIGAGAAGLVAALSAAEAAAEVPGVECDGVPRGSTDCRQDWCLPPKRVGIGWLVLKTARTRLQPTSWETRFTSPIQLR